MKPAIVAAEKIVVALKDVQALVLSRTDIISKALSTCVAAENDALAAAIAAETERHREATDTIVALIEKTKEMLEQENEEHENRLTRLRAQAENRVSAFGKLTDATMRLRGELEDGNGDGAAIIAQIFSPPASAEPVTGGSLVAPVLPNVNSFNGAA